MLLHASWNGCQKPCSNRFMTVFGGLSKLTKGRTGVYMADNKFNELNEFSEAGLHCIP